MHCEEPASLYDYLRSLIMISFETLIRRNVVCAYPLVWLKLQLPKNWFDHFQQCTILFNRVKHIQYYWSQF